MMKIDLLMKEYIGLHIYISMKFCSHILQQPIMCEYHLSTEDNKQTRKLSYLS